MQPTAEKRGGCTLRAFGRAALSAADFIEDTTVGEVVLRNSAGSPPAACPWLAIWTKPRTTIRSIVDSDPTRNFVPLAALGGVFQALGQASAAKIGDSRGLLQVLAICTILGPIAGIIGIYVFAFIVRMISRLLGGTASLDETRAAIAWSNVPVVAALGLWTVQIVVFENENFTTETPWIDSMAGNQLFLAFSILGVCLYWIARLWGILIGIACVAEVNRFSVLKAMVAFVVPVAFLLLMR